MLLSNTAPDIRGFFFPLAQSMPESLDVELGNYSIKEKMVKSSEMKKNALYLCGRSVKWTDEKGHEEVIETTLTGFVKNQDVWEFCGTEYGFGNGKIYGGDMVILTKEMFDSEVHDILELPRYGIPHQDL